MSVVIRPPRKLRVLAAAGSVPFLLFGITMAAVAARAGSVLGVVIVLLWLAVIVGITASNLTVGVTADGDELRIRNPLRHHRLRRSEIAGFGYRVPDGTRPVVGRSLVVMLRTGQTVRLRVTARFWFGPDRLDRWLADLRAWLAAGQRDDVVSGA